MKAFDTNAAEQIHQASLSLLKDPGIRFEHQESYDLLLKAGAKAGSAAQVVRIPQELVAEKLALCPSEIHLADLQGDGKRISATSAPAIWSVPCLHLYAGNVHRPLAREDLAGASRLINQLEHVDGMFGFAMDDVPPKARDVVGLRVMAENTCKHIRVLSFTPEGGEQMVEMKKVVGEHPWFSVGFTAHGPLRWTRLALEIFQSTAGHQIPATINGEPMAGVSAPVTLAGSCAVGNAEILAGIVLNQILEPGRPCIYNLGLAHIFDMRTAIAVTGGPENALYAQVSAAMGRLYNMPSASWVSTESMCPDAQAAMEKMFGFYTHMASGVSNIWAIGQLESEMTFSPAQAVIDNEMIGFVKRYLRGVEVSEETLAEDLVRQVGIAGNYLDQVHTAEHFREEFFMPSLLFRKTREAWNEEGGKRLDQRAEEEANQLMQEPVDCCLSDEQLKELDRLAMNFLKKV